jgi:hypothetical protein
MRCTQEKLFSKSEHPGIFSLLSDVFLVLNSHRRFAFGNLHATIIWFRIHNNWKFIITVPCETHARQQFHIQTTPRHSNWDVLSIPAMGQDPWPPTASYHLITYFPKTLRYSFIFSFGFLVTLPLGFPTKILYHCLIFLILFTRPSHCGILHVTALAVLVACTDNVSRYAIQ